MPRFFLYQQGDRVPGIYNFWVYIAALIKAHKVDDSWQSSKYFYIYSVFFFWLPKQMISMFSITVVILFSSCSFPLHVFKPPRLCPSNFLSKGLNLSCPFDAFIPNLLHPHHSEQLLDTQCQPRTEFKYKTCLEIILHGNKTITMYFLKWSSLQITM